MRVVLVGLLIAAVLGCAGPQTSLRPDDPDSARALLLVPPPKADDEAGWKALKIGGLVVLGAAAVAAAVVAIGVGGALASYG